MSEYFEKRQILAKIRLNVCQNLPWFKSQSFYSSFMKTASKPQFPTDLVTFTEEILNGKLHFMRSGN